MALDAENKVKVEELKLKLKDLQTQRDAPIDEQEAMINKLDGLDPVHDAKIAIIEVRGEIRKVGKSEAVAKAIDDTIETDKALLELSEKLKELEAKKAAKIAEEKKKNPDKEVPCA